MDVPLDTMPEYAREFVGSLPTLSLSKGGGALVVGLRGDLGAGKTTFVQQVAKVLGVKEAVTSPTFVLAQRYETTHPTFLHLIHIDAYRLEGETKDTIGFAEYMKDPSNLILVEWPDRVPGGLPSGTPTLHFETLNETTRRISQK